MREAPITGDAAVLTDVWAVGLPIMDRMYKECAPGEAPARMEALEAENRTALAFAVGEYN